MKIFKVESFFQDCVVHFQFLTRFIFGWFGFMHINRKKKHFFSVAVFSGPYGKSFNVFCTFGRFSKSNSIK